MIEEFLSHNLFWRDSGEFEKADPQLTKLRDFKHVAPLDWWKSLPLNEGAVYILTGGRQIGKSTSLKLLISHLLKLNTSREAVFYLPCDQIIDRSHLLRIIRDFLIQAGDRFFYLFLDELTFVPEWERTIKGLADEGFFRRGICVITGSDKVLLEQAATALPGRRGDVGQVDFVLRPLTFKEFVDLTHTGHSSSELMAAFEKFLTCGGFLKPLNELFMSEQIKPSTYQTYQQWIIGDFLKRQKKQEFLLEVLRAILTTLGSQVTFSDLSRRCPSLSKDTFIDYIQLLARMDMIHIQEAFDQNTRGPFPKKAKKIHFTDPFIAHAVSRLFSDLPLPDPSILVENLCVSHFSRHFPTYYLKADGEVDVIIVDGRTFHPFEIKWTGQVRPKDLKQIKKCKDGVILRRQSDPGTVDGIPAMSVIQKLMELG